MALRTAHPNGNAYPKSLTTAFNTSPATVIHRQPRPYYGAQYGLY
jgi:hypothetical protein